MIRYVNKIGVLYVCVLQGADRLVMAIMEQGASVNAVTGRGTALHMAAHKGRDTVCAVLIGAKAPTNAKDKMGKTALHVAAMSGKDAVCQVLVSSGANIDCIDDRGQTPLHYAAISGNEAICKMLIANGAQVSAQDKKGETPLHSAARSVLVLAMRSSPIAGEYGVLTCG